MSTTNRLTPPAAVAKEEDTLVRIAIAFTAWAERWFPDAFIFVAIAVVMPQSSMAPRQPQSVGHSATASGA
jgi:hypothetical protein